MPKFRYKAMTEQNKIVKGVYIADDEDDLREIITNQHYYLISCKKIQESSQMFSFLEKIKISDFTMFCRQFSIMLNAGMNVDETVRILARTTKNKKLKSILEYAYNNLLKGAMLSDCFDKYPKTFPIFFRNMIKIGEKSGRLDIVFKRLADYYDNDYKTRKQVKSALAYPLFLIFLAVAALIVMAVFVMPTFQGVFESFGSDNLPAISKMVISVSNFIKNNISQLLLIAFALIAILMLLKKIKGVKRFYDHVKLEFPIVKNVSIASLTTRFASAFAVLLSSGLQLLDSIDIISESINNIVVEEKLKIVKNQISIGKPISKSLDTINIFPPMLIEMISVGEKTGTLEDVLGRITQFFDEELKSKKKKATSEKKQ
ncbi:MAG: type II secretion system F family protein, partial [Bacilli bacterium]